MAAECANSATDRMAASRGVYLRLYKHQGSSSTTRLGEYRLDSQVVGVPDAEHGEELMVWIRMREVHPSSTRIR